MAQAITFDLVDVTVTDTEANIQFTGGNFNNNDRETVLSIVQDVMGASSARINNSASKLGQGRFMIELNRSS